MAPGLPAIPSPTIGATTGDRPAASGFTPAPTGFATHSKARPSTPTESSSPRRPARAVCVTDWSFSFRCSPPRLAATQLRFDTARLFTAQEQTSTALSPRLLRRTSAAVPAAARQRQRARAHFPHASVTRRAAARSARSGVCGARQKTRPTIRLGGGRNWWQNLRRNPS